MITLLHGENIVESRKALVQKINDSKTEGIDVVRLDGLKVEIGDFRSILGSASLLGKDRLAVIENFFSSPRSARKEKILECLKGKDFVNDLIFWEGKELKDFGNLPGAMIKVFKVAPAIFRFLESFRPNNTRQALSLLSEVKSKEDPEMIFYMIIRYVRSLILASDLGPIGLSGMADWQKRRFINQASSFSLSQLKKLYGDLEQIDYEQKTSGDVYSLASRLDLLVAYL